MGELQNRLIFVEYRPDDARDELAAVPLVTGGMTLPITSARVADFNAVFEALGRVKRRFPARLLRQLKEHVYDLVLHTEPKQRLFVQDIDADADVSQVEVVFGVGAVREAFDDKAKESAPPVARLGYRGVKRIDLVNDVLWGAGGLDPVHVVEVTAPEILKGAKLVPLYKYLRTGGYLDQKGSLVRQVPDVVAGAVGRTEEVLRPPVMYCRKETQLVRSGQTFADLVRNEGVEFALGYGPLLPWDRIDGDDLRDFLIEHADARDGSASTQTLYLRLVCLAGC